jgi:tetratricopeptide (TPR) repeat protein
VIEVRSPRGRFVDRREWRTGDSVTLKARIRPAFALITAQAAGGASASEVAAEVERALSAADGALVFAPPAKEVQVALAQANAPEGWLTVDPEAGAAAQRTRREARREIGRTLAERLEVQGVAAVTTGKNPDEIELALLAAGSAEPEVLRFSLADPASRDRALATLNAKLPPSVRPALEASIVDVANEPGAAVIRSQGVAAAAGLAVGDVIVGAGGSAVQNVAELRARVLAARPGESVTLSVKNPAGVERAVKVALASAADTVPLRDPGLVYNQFLADLQSLARTTRDPFAQSAIRLNLAIIQLRLGNPDEALKTLQEVTLPEGPGVSSATVIYLTGLALEALGRTADARAAFTKAAAATEGRLSADGPTIASMAATRLKTARP